ncbi:hypothetical protein SteCoe_12721 [Stentor coeruleus]|uniref:Uncharacterized protein n=1 Tax=Stentor coeruleus TaxID=5963 RepID=A0A1R2CA59_9CILI|nr:hypothetical protein SteCoe_12721 [Stentor coeruleus]
MDNSDDWCYFEKIAEIDLDIPYDANHTQNLISVNNKFGWVFLAIFQNLHIIKSEQLITYFNSNKPNSELKFSSEITHVYTDDYGKTLAIGRECNLDLLSFTEAIQGQNKSKAFILSAPIKNLEFFQNWLSVLLQSDTLELYQNTEKYSEKTNISSFAFTNDFKGIYFSSGSIFIATIPDFNIEKQVNVDYIPYSIGKFENYIPILGMISGIPNLFIYNNDLTIIEKLDCIETFPFSPHESLENFNKENLPFIGSFYYMPTRKTLAFSSTCAVSIDLLMTDNDFSIVNFEENTEGQCKVGWKDSYECVFRGFAFVTSYGPPKEDYEYKLKDSFYNIAQPPLVLYIGSNGVISLRKFIDLRERFLKDNLCVESKNVFNCREEVKFDVKTPIKKVEEKKETIVDSSDNKKKSLANENVFGNKTIEDKNSGLNLSSLSLSSENKNIFQTPSNKTPDVDSKNLGPQSKIGSTINPTSPIKNSFFVGEQPAKIENKQLNAPLIKPGEMAFFLNSTPKTEEKKLSAPLVNNDTNPFKNFQLKTEEQKIKTLSSKPENIPAVNNQLQSEEEEKKNKKPENSFLTPSQPKSDSIKPNSLFVKPGENNFFLNSQAKPEEQKLFSTFKQPEPGKFNLNPEPGKLNLNPEPGKFNLNPEPGKLNLNPEPGKFNLNPSPGKLNLNPEPATKDLKPAPVKPPEKPATISSKLMNEINEISKLIFGDIKKALSQLETKKISEAGLKTRETNILSLKPRIKKLSENYIKAKDNTNFLARNLDEFSLDIEDIRKVIDEDQTQATDDSHIGLFNTVKENERNLNIFKIYIDNSMTGMIHFIKGIKKDLGFKVDNIGTTSRFIKTRAYVPLQEEKVLITEEVLRKVIINRKNQAFEKLQDLKNKCKGLNRSTGRYSFDLD